MTRVCTPEHDCDANPKIVFCLCNKKYEKTKHTLEKNVYLVNEHINVAITSFTIRIIATIIRRAYITQEFINISVSESFRFGFVLRSL